MNNDTTHQIDNKNKWKNKLFLYIDNPKKINNANNNIKWVFVKGKKKKKMVIHPDKLIQSYRDSRRLI